MNGKKLVSEGAQFDGAGDMVSFLVEAAWLAYETPCLAADVISKWAGVRAEFKCCLEFVSVEYKCAHPPHLGDSGSMQVLTCRGWPEDVLSHNS